MRSKVAFVTGGSAGIGRITAEEFARCGAAVVVADVDRPGGEQAARELNDQGFEAVFVATDVTRSESVERAVAVTVERYGRLDCAFNNAGVEGGALVPFPEFQDADWDRVIGVNLTGVWLCMKHELLQMRKQGAGAIVNAASVMGVVASPNNPAYTASKHGVVGLTKSGALAGAEFGVRVNAVAPGYIRTAMVDRVLEGDEEKEAEAIAKHPLGRIGSPIEVARAVVWLCSDAASFVTGDVLMVDGGFVAR
jgi:NAD(P)-dependent dehydrogenase (short-subunit alcohol dehydrogenase family)